MEKSTVIIVDDHKMVRESLNFILGQDPYYQVIAECSSGEEAIEKSKELLPDIVMLDITLPGINGFEATAQIRKVSPESKILAVSMHFQPSYARQMIQIGAMGYLTKGSSKEELFLALKTILEGRKYICNQIKNIVSEHAFKTGDEKGNGINLLSKREKEIIHFIKKGLPSKEIAEVLYISKKTVEVHRYNILKKLKLKNTPSLIDFIHKNDPDLE